MATDWAMGGNELEPVDRRQNGGKNGGKDEFEIYTLKFSTKSMPNHLKSLTIKNLKKLSAGKHPIGIVPGLYLFKNSNGNSSFVLRYTSQTQSKRRHIGLGSLNQVSVKEACEKAIEYKKLISDGIDPIEYKRHQKLQTQTQALEEIISFKKVTLEWHGARSFRI